MKIQKRAFTLVELIVVIVILSILGTIAFISLQGYGRDARNAIRSTDMANIEKILTVYKTTYGKFPLPTDGQQVTYSGSEVWIQGTFGEDTRKEIGNRGNISQIPVDPLTGNEYTYSILNTKQEHQLAGVFEGNIALNSSNIANAAGEYGIIKIVGNYNGKVAKVETGSIIYVLAVPSIISGDIRLTNIVDLLFSKKLAFNKSHILPSSYSGTTAFQEKLPDGNIVNTGSLIVYETNDINSLKQESNQQILIDNLQKAYSGTVVKNIQNIKQILSAKEDRILLAQTIINNNLLKIEKIHNTLICGLDRYLDTVSKTCKDVGVGYYSPVNNNIRNSCTNKPTDNENYNYVYTTSGGGSNNCSYSSQRQTKYLTISNGTPSTNLKDFIDANAGGVTKVVVTNNGTIGPVITGDLTGLDVELINNGEIQGQKTSGIGGDALTITSPLKLTNNGWIRGAGGRGGNGGKGANKNINRTVTDTVTNNTYTGYGFTYRRCHGLTLVAWGGNYKHFSGYINGPVSLPGVSGTFTIQGSGWKGGNDGCGAGTRWHYGITRTYTQSTTSYGGAGGAGGYGRGFNAVKTNGSAGSSSSPAGGYSGGAGGAGGDWGQAGASGERGAGGGAYGTAGSAGGKSIVGTSKLKPGSIQGNLSGNTSN